MSGDGAGGRGNGMSVSGSYTGVRCQGVLILVSFFKLSTSSVMVVFFYALICKLFCLCPRFLYFFQKFSIRRFGKFSRIGFLG